MLFRSLNGKLHRQLVEHILGITVYDQADSLLGRNTCLLYTSLEIPVDPYEAFRCDVPNLSTSLYFVVNDAFYNKALPKVELPEGVIAVSYTHLLLPDQDAPSQPHQYCRR